jgi:hypothetical protein
MNRTSRDERIHGLKAFRVEIFAKRNDNLTLASF